MTDSKQICFIGAGSMAEAILSGLLQHTDTKAEAITMINRQDKDRIETLQNRYGIISPENKEAAVRQADTVILATKPKDMDDALAQWGDQIQSGQRVISVAAGIPTPFIEERLSAHPPVVRAMPNTSSMVGASATALCPGRNAAEADLDEAIRIFSAIGTTVVVKEEEMDAVTGLSGSGPAYIYYLVEAMEQAGVNEGLSPAVARNLTLQTMAGAARMLLETREEPSELRRRVTSPGGTTMAGLNTLEKHRFQEALIDAVHQARRRSQELGNAFPSPTPR